jgi:Tfp pilus assembly ATPase PilU
VGLDTKSFHRALRSAMRAAPDVILIGEIRDRESMEYAITFAGTGHLCLATLHANNAAETLDRIINMFPRDQHSQIFLDLSQYLKAILSQRLVMGKDGRRCAALEVLLNTPHVQELVKKGDVVGVKESLVRSSEKGMQSFDYALYELYLDGKITLEEAISNADSRTNLEAKINFGARGVRVPWRAGIPDPSCLAKADMLGWTDPESPPDARRLSEFFAFGEYSHGACRVAGLRKACGCNSNRHPFRSIQPWAD